MRVTWTLLVAFLVAWAPLLWATPSGAVNPDEVLSDPVLEKRAREISKELRCLVCQNQSIDDSDAGLAKDLRVIVRERLTAGDSDTMILDFVVARYGDFVLLKPPFKGATLVLWLGPGVIAAFGLFAMIAFMRRRRPMETDEGAQTSSHSSSSSQGPLTADEQRRIEKLLKDDHG